MNTTVKKALMWIAASMLVLILADFYPKAAKLLVGLLIVGVLLINYQKYTSLFNGITANAAPQATTPVTPLPISGLPR